MALVADGRVHLGVAAQPLVGLRARQGEVLRRGLHAGHVLVAAQEGHLLGRGHVQHVDALAEAPRDGDQALRALDGALGVAHLRMTGPVAGARQGAALGEAVLVLRVEGGAAGHVAQDVGHARVVRHQQGAGGGAHEHLDPAAARQALQLAEVAGVLVGAADVEGVVAVHAAAGAAELVGQGLGRGGGRIRVGHLEHGGDAAQHGGAAARLKVLLPLEPGLAEVHLGVDHARQHGEAPRVHRLGRGGVGQVADAGHAAVAHAHVGGAAPGVVHHLAAADDQVEGRGHGAGIAPNRGGVVRLSPSARPVRGRRA